MRFVDGGLPPEALDRIEQHVEECGRCAAEVAALRELIFDVAAGPEVAPTPVKVSQHIDDVMHRIKTAPAAPPRRAWTVWGVGGAAAALAAAALMLVLGDPTDAGRVGQFAARGGPGESSLSRDVDLQLYSKVELPKALNPGDGVAADMPLLVGTRNLGETSAFLLCFAVDAANAVHWIAPEYTVSWTDPLAYEIAPSEEEQLVPTAVVFDDLAPGRLRVVSLITAEQTRVSQIEALTPEELTTERLMERFPRAEVRQITLRVTP
jgi:hypothetical protein